MIEDSTTRLRYDVEIIIRPQGPNPDRRAYSVGKGAYDPYDAGRLAIERHYRAEPAGIVDGDEFTVTVTDRAAGKIVKYDVTADVAADFSLVEMEVEYREPWLPEEGES
jgi:predicted NUDIX family NTP pyrophosphohydrolase